MLINSGLVNKIFVSELLKKTLPICYSAEFFYIE